MCTVCQNYIDIDGLEGLKLIFGIIAVEGKGNPGKVAKVNKTKEPSSVFFFFGFFH